MSNMTKCRMEASKRIRDLLRKYPAMEKCLTRKEKTQLSKSLAEYLYRHSKENQSEEEQC